MPITPLSPTDARAMIAKGARLIDIRSSDEHARSRIARAENIPLDRLDTLRIADGTDGTTLIFHCRSGMRTQGNASALQAAAGDCSAYILEGGIDAWRAAGNPTLEDRSQPFEIMRQVQITAGALVLLGVLLGHFVHGGFIGLSAFIGAGLMFAGISGWCGMAHLLRVMPWNRSAASG